MSQIRCRLFPIAAAETPGIIVPQSLLLRIDQAFE